MLCQEIRRMCTMPGVPAHAPYAWSSSACALCPEFQRMRTMPGVLCPNFQRMHTMPGVPAHAHYARVPAHAHYARSFLCPKFQRMHTMPEVPAHAHYARGSSACALCPEFQRMRTHSQQAVACTSDQFLDADFKLLSFKCRLHTLTDDASVLVVVAVMISKATVAAVGQIHF